MEKPDQETSDKWRDDPANWRAGIFYYNPKDKRIFPPKRSNLGWTINFATPYSIVVAVVSIAVIYIIIKLYA